MIRRISDFGIWAGRRKTGFIVETEDDAVRAVLKLDQLDRRTVRRVFEERFTSDVMARNYLRL